MRLRDVPDTRAEFLDWIDDYERRTFTPSVVTIEFCRAVSEHQRVRPAGVRPTIRHLVVSTLEPQVRDLLDTDAPQPVLEPAPRVGVRVLDTARPVDHLRLDRTRVDSFSRVGPNPYYDAIGYEEGVKWRTRVGPYVMSSRVDGYRTMGPETAYF